jgi:hypothetical protein
MIFSNRHNFQTILNLPLLLLMKQNLKTEIIEFKYQLFNLKLLFLHLISREEQISNFAVKILKQIQVYMLFVLFYQLHSQITSNFVAELEDKGKTARL